jgi:hypothetical protein
MPLVMVSVTDFGLKLEERRESHLLVNGRKAKAFSAISRGLW